MTGIILDVRKFHPEGDGWHTARVCPNCGRADCEDVESSTYYLWLWLDDRNKIVGQIEHAEGGMFYGRLPDIANAPPTYSLVAAKQYLNAMADEYITLISEEGLTTELDETT